MNAWIAEVQSRFAALEKREQQALLALAAFFGMLTFYFAVWSPLVGFQLRSEQDYDRNQELLVYLRSTEASVSSAAVSPQRSGSNGQTMLTTVSRAAQSVGLKPSRLQPEGGDAVSVWFDSVGFNSLMLWVERLESSSIVVKQISIDRIDEPGQVSARVVLRN